MKTRCQIAAAAGAAAAAAVLGRIVVLCLSVAALSCVGSGEPSGEISADRDSSAPSGTETASGASSRDSAVVESGAEFEVAAEEAPAAAPIAKADSAEVPVKAARSSALPQASGLAAGFADDNEQFNYFTQFLEKYGTGVPHYPLDVSERIGLRILDREGKSIPNAGVRIYDGEQLLCEGQTYADGGFLFFPSEYGGARQQYRAIFSVDQLEESLSFDRYGKRNLETRLGMKRQVTEQVPLDLLFILDTTGSMGEEINRLKVTIELINLNIASLSVEPQVRFGMVLYRDRGDQYVTEVVPLTADLDSFTRSLGKVEAGGGGDQPEDLQEALSDAVKNVAWNTGGIRLSFIITDAPPHLDYGQEFTYVDAAREARRQGVKIFSVGTSGLDLAGEYVLRQVSQYTAAKYIFLTHGEQGESEGGTAGSVSHHTGANYQTDRLEAIIIRIAKEELSHLADRPLEDEEGYFSAMKIASESREETLEKLYDQALAQLVDYSTIRIAAETATAAIPIMAADQSNAVDAEYLTEQLVLSLSRHPTFRMVERRDLQTILEELELQLSGLVEEENAVKVGGLLGSDILVSTRMYDRPQAPQAQQVYELYIKLLRVETGEILSVTKAVVDKKLGLQADGE